MQLTRPNTATLMSIPSGVDGVVETLRIMSRLVKEGKKMLPVRLAALSLSQSCLQKDRWCEIQKLHGFVRDEIRYVEDIRDVETLQTPDKTLEFRAGDCDDKATLLAAMLESIGFTTRFIAIGFQPGVFEHVYGEVKFGGAWVPLETTEPWQVGDEPPPEMIAARYVWHN